MKLAHRIPSILSRLQSTHAIPKIVQLYNGSLSDVYRKLKVFSFGSLGAAVAISPIIAILDAPINTAGRVFLITTALGTSVTSTAMINWCGKPYVSSMKVLVNPSNSRQSVELITHSLTLRKLRTVVHDTQWLRRADRPLASWEVSDGELTSTIGEGRDHDVREVIAETFDVKSDKKIGEWFVIWKRSGDSLTAEVQKSGAVDRYFNVDEKSVPSVKVP
ncbi:hypothetical protein WALSEDRAFT_46690 [Wallemia mellicola CBS 633.66]|uniref:Uncharacterized protein n=1 Tax=Wallemia mellicola (strain ATCC MYA-4683 / CBS 633.66) TaxID=671144 RepID=I4YB72_WALMC|nr:hypothetical protein WALSEDRAFT_46690 [Wallemia mellicola CBS 633.66]EIM21214.1 hypothetical protein WALSEDRAFT_46690 [Wallemia mellicola CBS 633.66]|eukprot:XP_006958886.1 hypothetical protein WALSEDRAFT_46690 [Wallemia mellicola CBS 633.66]